MRSSPLNLVAIKNINLVGEGPDVTVLHSVGGLPVVQCNGLWRSRFEGLMFRASGPLAAGCAVFDLDGNYDGLHTMGVQGNIFINCGFDAGMYAAHAFALARRGLGAAQGSENQWFSCQFYGGTTSAFLCNGPNALQNQLWGGNFQSFPACGIRIAAGNVNVFGVGFQSTYGYQQLLNDGYDIDNSNFTAGDIMQIAGCRTESLRFYRGGGNAAIIDALAHVPAIDSWSAGAKELHTAIAALTHDGNMKLYVTVVRGSTGPTSPAWPESGTVRDGSVVWQQVDFNVIDNAIKVVIRNSQIHLGQVSGSNDTVCDNVRFSRVDASPLLSSGIPPSLFRQCSRNGNMPLTIGNNPRVGATLQNLFAFDLGTGALVFRRKETGGGNMAADVSLQQGIAHAEPQRCTLALSGGLEFATLRVVSDLRAGVFNPGTFIGFVSDAVAGTSPCRAGGSGALVYTNDGQTFHALS